MHPAAEKPLCFISGVKKPKRKREQKEKKKRKEKDEKKEKKREKDEKKMRDRPFTKSLKKNPAGLGHFQNRQSFRMDEKFFMDGC